MANAQAIQSKNLWLGTKTTYVPLQEKYTPAPAGFKPVFINYVGRHGARHQTKAGPDVAILNILLLAEKHQALTVKGMQLIGKVKTLVSIEKNNYGNISLSGADEQTGIGTRMFQHYPAVFKGNGILVTTTEEVRTQQSCKAFLKAFASYDANKIIIKTPTDSNNNALRFYDISPAYLKYKEDGNWQSKIAILEKKANLKILYNDVAKQFFKASFLDSLAAEQIGIQGKKGKMFIYNTTSFTNDLNALYAISYSLKKELIEKQLPDSAIGFSVYFTEKQLNELDELNNADDYLKKGPAACNTCVQVTDAVPLLVDFITTTDDFIKNKNKDAVLRFAHAETISPFAALLEIKGASQASDNINIYRSIWDASKVIPLSANIQLILYNTPKGYFIKMLLNEKEVQLPLAAVNGCYYNWEKVRAFYLNKLNKMHVGLKDDMHQFLIDLK